jgi:hypothetical protein
VISPNPLGGSSNIQPKRGAPLERISQIKDRSARRSFQLNADSNTQLERAKEELERVARETAFIEQEIQYYRGQRTDSKK